MGRLLDRLQSGLGRVLTRPHGNYQHVLPNDPVALRDAVRKGDVVLVDGEQRVSEVIKYLTQSSWSHVALYVGDELWRRATPSGRRELELRYGTEARHLVVEALMEGGVVTSPLAKYTRHNLRICRPHGLRPDDCQRILDEVLDQLGSRYDVRNILDLARYLLPVTLIPGRFRRPALERAGATTREVICSTLVARAFQNVGFPILPQVTHVPADAPRGWRAWLRPRGPYPALFHRQHERLVTPRDFDLSPYFEIVKFNVIEARRFDYRRIRWA